MGAQGIVLSEKNFHQWYKNLRRSPHEDPDAALAVVEVFAQRPERKERCTASEALRFLALTHCPPERLAEAKAWFPATAWRRAVQEELTLLRAHLDAEADIAIHPVENIPPQAAPSIPSLDVMPIRAIRLDDLLFKQGPHPVQAYFRRPNFADLCTSLRGAAQRGSGGIVLYGPPMVGKTRTTLEALRQTVPDHLLFPWPMSPCRPEYLASLRGQRVVVLLDDAHELVRRQVVGEVLVAVRALRAITQSCLIVATCRSGGDQDNVLREFGALIDHLAAFHLAPIALESAEHHDFLDAVRHHDPAQHIDAARFDGTPGSVFLGVDRRTMQLRNDACMPMGAKAILKALALLRAASIYDYAETRVRRVTEAVFQIQGSWTEHLDYLLRAEWVRLEPCEGASDRQVRVLTDAYLDVCLPQSGIYPQPGRRIQDDFAALAHALMADPIDVRALFRLSRALYFEDEGPISTWMECALACAQTGLQTLGRVPDPLLEGEGQLALGRALWRRTVGNRADNLERALLALRAAEQAFHREHAPYEWAEVQRSLGHVLADREQGERAENLEQAIECYHAAAQVLTRDAFIQMWARLQGNLGNVYTDRLRGDKADNLEQALAAYQAALQVYSRAATPVDWAREHVKLGEAYASRIHGDKAANLAQAIAAYTTALQVFTRATYPFQWAFIHYDWGNALLQMPLDDRAGSTEQAIAHFQDALRVMHPDQYPYVWALIHVSLGHAYRLRLIGERAANHALALAAYTNAARTLTASASPQHWAEIQAGIARLEESPQPNIARMEAQMVQ